jgi:transcriptional regulator with XRE-family HTH domain
MARKRPFSQQIRDVIEARGLTLAELGGLTGVDPTIIGRFLKAERGLSAESLDKIAAALDLRVIETAGAKPRKKGKRP